MWLVMGHAWIFVWLKESDPVYLIGQDKMIPLIALRTKFEVDIDPPT
jgi:hypothetical protein